MLNKIKSIVTSKPFLIGVAVGGVFVLAYRRLVPAAVKNAANALPGSDAKA